MRVTQKNSGNKKKIIIIFSALAVIIAAFCVWFFVIKDNFPAGAEKNNPEQQAVDTKDKQNFIDNSKEGESNPDGALSNGNTDDSKVIITPAQQSDTIVISTKLYDYSDGTCLLKVTNGTKQSSQTAPIIFQSEYSTCAGFSVSRDDLGIGTWTIELTVTSKGQSVVKTASLDVN